MLWRCWLGGRKGIRPVKTEWWGAGVVICLELGADLHMAQLMPLPLTVSCFSKIQIGFAFLVPAHPGSPGNRAVKRVCVCMCVRALDPVCCQCDQTATFEWYDLRSRYFSCWLILSELSPKVKIVVHSLQSQEETMGLYKWLGHWYKSCGCNLPIVAIKQTWI